MTWNLASITTYSTRVDHTTPSTPTIIKMGSLQELKPHIDLLWLHYQYPDTLFTH
jgi:hypothetical protein